MLRRTSFALALCLAVGSARASAEAPNPAPGLAKPAKKRVGRVPFRVVKLLPETGQALVYDQDRRAHVLVAEGDQLGAFAIVEVDEDTLVVARDGRELVLVVDPRAPRMAADAAPLTVDPYGGLDVHGATAIGVPAGGAVVDPYGPPIIGDPGAPHIARRPIGMGLGLGGDTAGGTIDPYGPPPDRGPGREVLAPPSQRASLQGAAVVDPYDALGARPVEPRVVSAPAAATPIKATPAPGSPSAPEALRTDVMTVQRRELEAALSDFARLGKDIGFTALPRGVRLGKVASGSYFWKLGLRDGDIVTAIDGKPLRTLDDAAAAYVRLGAATKLAVDVERAGARGTLRFALK